MNGANPNGVCRTGLDAEFAAAEAQKSNILLRARTELAQGRDRDAAAHFAEAAGIEELLADRCDGVGRGPKAAVHRFSAASCWAQAGNFFRALELCDQLIAHADLPATLRETVDAFEKGLTKRRKAWYTELTVASGADEA